MKNITTETAGAVQNESTNDNSSVNQTVVAEAPKKRGRRSDPNKVHKITVGEDGLPLGKGARKVGSRLKVIYLSGSEKYVPGNLQNVIKTESFVVPERKKNGPRKERSVNLESGTKALNKLEELREKHLDKIKIIDEKAAKLKTTLQDASKKIEAIIDQIEKAA